MNKAREKYNSAWCLIAGRILTLKMEAVCYSETLDFYRKKLRHIPVIFIATAVVTPKHCGILFSR
jgi:hypothetical protein